jgi:hypothetical protein
MAAQHRRRLPRDDHWLAWLRARRCKEHKEMASNGFTGRVAAALLLAGACAGVFAAPLPPGAGFDQHVQLQGSTVAGFLFDQGDFRYDPEVTNAATIMDSSSGLFATASVHRAAARFYLQGGFEACPIGSGGSGICPFTTAYRSDATIILNDVIRVQGVDNGSSGLRLHFSGKVEGAPFAGDDFNRAYGGAGAIVQLFVRSSSATGFADSIAIDSLGLSDPETGCAPSINCLFTIDTTRTYPLQWSGDSASWSVQATIRGYATGTWEADFGSTAALGIVAGPGAAFSSASASFPVSPVPEPGMAWLMVCGLAAVALAVRSRRRPWALHSYR